ncbi:MAG: 16S rRNA (adenine(1518)-N(6)/adenine(1519)-N(6))-dimethyltransferase RsmA [Gemmatimonadales bacterium]|nr:16S rRNA (adenine(1518)-N(6)/adenine(1519)-N(6))-dimethyltransferase RsmA [Gemmatimonadales bacterium]
MRLGQHFLSDPGILGRIADALDPVPGETVIEIGPGKGTLTEILLARGLMVIAVEKDRALAEELRARYAVRGERENLTVIAGDALRLDWHRFPAHRAPLTAHKIIGNIPYYITSPLLEKAMEPPLPARIVFLVQAEVADRIAAPPGGKTYGALSVGVQAVCRVERLFTVAPGAFRPPPKVRSALLRLTPLAEPLVAPAEAKALRAFVTACFSRRRKQLHNAVPGATAEGLRALGFDPRARPETLAPRDFVRLLRGSAQL